MTKITVLITKEVLEKTKMCGLNGNMMELVSQNCAVAYAVRELFPNASVGAGTISLDSSLENKTPLSIKAQNFISAFDFSSAEERVLMPEVSFEIDVPDGVLSDIDISEVQRIVENSSTLEFA